MAWLAGGVAAAAFTLYAATACRTVPFGDAGELIAATAGLGVAHPPGYPLYTVLGRIALAVPIGEPALRMALLSAVAGAAVCAAVSFAVGTATGSRAGSIAAGAGLAVSPTLWAVATVAEVYTLHLVFVAALLGCAWAAGLPLAGRRRRAAIVGGGAILGLALAHHPTVVLALPSAAILVLGRDAARIGAGKARDWIASAVLAVTVPAGLYASLLWRARAHPSDSWGAVSTVADLVAHASAATYGLYDMGWAGLGRPAAWSTAAGLVGPEALGAAGGLALLGAWWGLRPRSGARRLTIALLALTIATLIFSLRYDVEDVAVYYLPGIAAIAALAGFGVAAIEGGAKSRLRLARLVGAGAVAALTVAIPANRHFSARDLSSLTAAADYGRDILATLPRGAVLFVDGDDAFILAYLTRVLGERRDVVVFDRTGALFRDAAREPGLPGPAGEALVALRQRRERAMVEATRHGGSPPIHFLGRPGYELDPGLRFEPVGLLFRVTRAEDPPIHTGARWTEDREAAVRDQALRLADPFGLAVAATYPIMRGERALFEGRLREALAAFEEAERIGGSTEATRNTLGTIYGRTGHLERAVVQFEEAVRLHPTSLRGWMNLATARSLLGDRAGAEAAAARADALLGR